MNSVKQKNAMNKTGFLFNFSLIVFLCLGCQQISDILSPGIIYSNINPLSYHHAGAIECLS